MHSGFNSEQFAHTVEQAAIDTLSTTTSGARVEATRLVQEMAEAVCTDLVGQDQKLDCRAGCSHCCIVNVAVLWSEAESVVEYLIMNRTAAELIEFHHLLHNLDIETRWLDDEERIMSRINCAFLSVGGSCSIYPLRPLLCRALTSTDAAACKDALSMLAFDENIPITANLLQQEIHETAFEALGKALASQDLDDRSHRLTGSIRALLYEHLN